MASSIQFRAAAYNDSVVVKGFDGLSKALRDIGDGADKELRRRILDIGARVALVAAANAPRMGPNSQPSDTSGFPGELQHSIKVSAFSRGASVYSTAVYGGAQNYGAGPKLGWGHRGPHIKRSDASHYMDRAVAETAPYVEKEVESVLDWAMTTFQEK